MRQGNLDRNMARIAVAVGVSLFLHTVASLVVTHHADKWIGATLSALLLVVTGLLISFLNVGLYNHLRKANETIALWLLIISSFAAFGSVAHGGYDLAIATSRSPNDVLDIGGKPNATDPFGMLTFGLTGIAVAGWTWLKGKEEAYHPDFLRLGYSLAILLLLLFVGRLTGLDPNGWLVTGLVAVTGLILSPAWYIWLGKHWKDWT